MALDSGDPPLRTASRRSSALRSVSPLSPEPTGCDPTPETLEGHEVATAPYHLDGTGKSSCRAPARIVDAAHDLLDECLREVGNVWPKYEPGPRKALVSMIGQLWHKWRSWVTR